MPRARLQESAKHDYQKALEAIENFFVEVQSEEKIPIWQDRFKEDFLKALNLIAKDPRHYPVCTLYPFNEIIDFEVRYFRAGWFYGLYVIHDDGPRIYRIVSNKSDLSTAF